MWVQKSTVALKSLSAALFICRHHPYCHVRVAVDNDWTCCPRYLPFPQLCSEHLREYGPPESLLHSNGPLWPTYLQFMPAKLQSCHFRKETGFHFPRGPQIKPLNKRKVVGRCWTKRRKKAGKKKKKSWWRKGSKSSHTCSAQRWVLPRGGWGTSLAEQSPGGPWHSKEPRGPASWWSGTAESLGSHGSLSEETAQPLFFCHQTAINIFCPLIQKAEGFKSDRVQECVLYHFSLQEISRWRIKMHSKYKQSGEVQLRTVEVNASTWFKPVVSVFKSSSLGTLQDDFCPSKPGLHLAHLCLWWYLHKPPLSNPFWGIEVKAWGTNS